MICIIDQIWTRHVNICYYIVSRKSLSCNNCSYILNMLVYHDLALFYFIKRFVNVCYQKLVAFQCDALLCSSLNVLMQFNMFNSKTAIHKQSEGYPGKSSNSQTRYFWLCWWRKAVKLPVIGGMLKDSSVNMVDLIQLCIRPSHGNRLGSVRAVCPTRHNYCSKGFLVR